MHFKLPYGVQNGRLVNISEVERGLGCGCTCPGCGERLIARKGVRNVHHFAHYQGVECPSGLETTFHLKAKEVFERRRKIVLPPVRLPNLEEPLLPGLSIELEQVFTERRIGRIIPDILARAKGKWLIIEIAVTHPTEQEKIDRIRQMNCAAVEIDAAAITRELCRDGRPFDSILFERFLVFSEKYKQWLFNPRKNEFENRLRDEGDLLEVKYRQYPNFHSYTASPCPEEKRTGGHGFFANVQQDCLHCPFCLEINYSKEYRGSREITTSPASVLCWGKIQDRLEEFRKNKPRRT